jgi:hypothetical protein
LKYRPNNSPQTLLAIMSAHIDIPCFSGKGCPPVLRQEIQ